jgi:hypothetical protein
LSQSTNISAARWFSIRQWDTVMFAAGSSRREHGHLRPFLSLMKQSLRAAASGGPRLELEARLRVRAAALIGGRRERGEDGLGDSDQDGGAQPAVEAGLLGCLLHLRCCLWCAGNASAYRI